MVDYYVTINNNGKKYGKLFKVIDCVAIIFHYGSEKILVHLFVPEILNRKIQKFRIQLF